MGFFFHYHSSNRASLENIAGTSTENKNNTRFTGLADNYESE